MKNVFAAAAITALIASPALAQSELTGQTERLAQAQGGASSDDVYFGTKWLGRDPDPNVRFEMRRDNYRQR
jgi:hypothetical protein